MRPQVWLGADGIVRVDHGNDPLITLEDIQWAVARQQELADCPCPVIVFGSGRPSVPPEVKRYLSGPALCGVTSALAYVLEGWYLHHLFRLSLLYNRPQIPCFAFSNEPDAVAWLQRYLTPPAQQAE
ncbi:hypothetical protein [Leeia sp.]|uniref:DUF7793 family protein n=1 Tax=Leeia sp. TaxID=2884678 RepID=UPI0035B2D9CD